MACCAKCAQAAPAVLGWIGSDVADWAGGAAADVASAVAAVPGVDVIVEAAADFARTSVGQVVTRAIATALTGGLAPVLGPQLATIAWTVPGVLRGDPWDQAWLAEFGHRAEQAATVLGGEAGAVFGAQLDAAIRYLAARIPAGQLVQWTAQQLAAAVGIRVDVAALAVDLVNRGWREAKGAWDPATGLPIPAPRALAAPQVITPGVADLLRAELAASRARTVPASPIAQVSAASLRSAGLLSAPQPAATSSQAAPVAAPVRAGERGTAAAQGPATAPSAVTYIIGVATAAALGFAIARAVGASAKVQGGAAAAGAAGGALLAHAIGGSR